eukprot:GEMP01027804.1.p1 GENE.GEMP01027804.1~~GEMP01027804.1.p1  ORF type:complete len:221 (+),score=16.98 GEMP01027804.1:159-821(+)
MERRPLTEFDDMAHLSAGILPCCNRFCVFNLAVSGILQIYLAGTSAFSIAFHPIARAITLFSLSFLCYQGEMGPNGSYYEKVYTEFRFMTRIDGRSVIYFIHGLSLVGEANSGALHITNYSSVEWFFLMVNAVLVLGTAAVNLLLVWREVNATNDAAAFAGISPRNDFASTDPHELHERELFSPYRQFQEPSVIIDDTEPTFTSHCFDRTNDPTSSNHNS